ncbi:hypothetical protein ACVFI8_16145 [Agarivorans sp. MS3-6]|uniref:hypothetical protein n=1 Tax=Agarivorans sp. TSD2052 TaxID=2937286 RepID=UPI00200C6D92|nr:hypothetical protein [Agarivorans sp. TSD2052]UPW17607.1 hypothetical protein M0C34_15360 [Agarivorans sp. TSD2052]
MSPLLFIRCPLSILQIVSTSYPSSAVAKGVTLATSQSTPTFIIKSSVSGIQLDIIQQAIENYSYKINELINSKCRVERMIILSAVDAIVSSPNNGEHAYLSEPVIFYQNIAISVNNRQLAIDNISALSQFKLMGCQNTKTFLGNVQAKVAA